MDPPERYHAARFRREALEAIAAIRDRGRLPLVVGGTGLYVRALLKGLYPAPPADPALRRELEASLAAQGPEALHRRLAARDPAAAARLHPRDRVRIVRALEVDVLGGAGPATPSWRGAVPPFRLLMVGLRQSREALARRIADRVRDMVARGMMDEVRRLFAAGYDDTLPAMGGIGYRQFGAVLRGEMTEAEAVRLMTRDTVRYAKRQMTWFARDPEIRWLDVDAVGGPARSGGGDRGLGPRGGAERVSAREKAVLAALRRPKQPRFEVDESLDELGRLAESAGAEVVGRMTQDRRAPTPGLYFGKGKIEELREWSREQGANLMISDDSLSPIQERNLGGSLGLKVIDRTALILDIFAQRARTMEGKLQVELAQLSYLLPAAGGAVEAPRAARRRHRHAGTRRDPARVGPPDDPPPHPEAPRGAQARAGASPARARPASGHRLPGGRARRLHQRRQDHPAQPAHRSRAGRRGPALRDARSRPRGWSPRPATRRSSSPTPSASSASSRISWSAAFKATLEELAEADLLVHVVDASHPGLEDQMAAVESLLAELELAERPTIVALNKTDRLDGDGALRALTARFNAVALSARTGEGVETLLERIGQEFRPRAERMRLLIPYRDGPALALCYERGRVLARADLPEGIRVEVEVPRRLAGQLEAYRESD